MNQTGRRKRNGYFMSKWTAFARFNRSPERDRRPACAQSSLFREVSNMRALILIVAFLVCVAVGVGARVADDKIETRKRIKKLSRYCSIPEIFQKREK